MMNVSTYMADCCGVSAIANLGSHKNAEEAMKQFCKAELVGYGDAFVIPNVYYVFTAGPEVPAGQPGSSHHSKAWVKYGTEFAAYIVEHGLGDIATLGQHLNLKYHPNTTCQVWLWHPNAKALKAWWKGVNKPKVDKKE